MNRPHWTAAVTVLSILAMGLPQATADTVSATPGVIQGVIHFVAPVTPDNIGVDARDATNTYTGHGVASQGGPTCPAGSQFWCYSVTVESALANNYQVRPIANLAKSSPVFVQSRIRFRRLAPPTLAWPESP